MRPRLPRLFRRAVPPEEQTYKEIVWENAMEAYESTPDEPVEITPYVQSRLDAMKAELLLKAHRMKRDHDRIARERRRRIRVGVLTAGFLVVGAAGASALTDTGTGIPLVDRVLGTPQQREHDAGDFSPGTSLPTPEDVRVRQGGSVASIPVRGSAESDTLLVSAFASENDRVCLVLARSAGKGLADVVGGSSCQSPGYIRNALGPTHALIVTAVADRVVIVTGYVARDVESLQLRGPHGPLDVDMTDPWDSGLPGLDPMRLFVGTVASEALKGGTDPEEADRAIDARLYEIRVTLADGRVITEPPRP